MRPSTNYSMRVFSVDHFVYFFVATTFTGATPIASAGYAHDINASGDIDAAVIYTNFFNYPYSAKFVDEAGGLRLGDSVGVANTITVADNGSVVIDEFTGSFRNRTFGNRDIHSIITVGAERNGSYLTAGEIISGYDIVYTRWEGFDDGLNEFGFGARGLFVQFTLIAEPGTLVDENDRILARNADEFSSLIIDAHIHMTWPNAISYDSFATDPDFTITPAPGVLAPIALGVSFAARRRRQPRLAGACASLIEHHNEYDSGNQER